MLPEPVFKGPDRAGNSRIGRRLDKAGNVGAGNSWAVASYPHITVFLHTAFSCAFFLLWIYSRTNFKFFNFFF